VISVPRLNEQWQQQHGENFLVVLIISLMLMSDALAADHVVCPLEASSQMEFRPLLVVWVILQMYFYLQAITTTVDLVNSSVRWVVDFFYPQLYSDNGYIITVLIYRGC
jgi:hypothetical protein